jgi:sulfur carrier protein
MQITVNGTRRDVQETTLAAILAECGFSGRVATAVNEEFVPVSARDVMVLKEGDRLEVLGAMQGG